MAEKSLADTIIDNYTYTTEFKNSSSKYIGDENSWFIPSQPEALTTEFIDIDRYYNHYNVVSPRVDIEFRTGDGENDWTSLKQLVTDEGSFVYTATIERVNENNTKTVSEKEVTMKDGIYKIDEKEVKVGDEINGGKITAINKTFIGGNNNNNYFVSATIEDTGFRTLQLELFDRTFTTIQAMLYDAIKHASSQETKNIKTTNSKTNFDLEFVEMPALTRNNIRIRYGFNDKVDATVPAGYWSTIGLNNEFYQGDDKYRWVSRTFNDKGKSLDMTKGEASKGGTTNQNVSFDNVLYYLNNQSTILGGFEEFYITNVQSTLTNTGIRYTITAVGSDALKLNGYKFVQKYANIVDKPKNVLASLMRCFNFSGTGTNISAKNTNQTMLKLVWNDERPLIPVKKILPTKDGYAAYSADQQREELEKDKIILSNYKEKLTVAQRLLGCLTSEAGGDYIAGSIIEQKKLYPKWKISEDEALKPTKFNAITQLERGSTIWLNCYAQIKGITPQSLEKEAFLAYYLKNYGNRIAIKLEDGWIYGDNGTITSSKPVYNCDESDVPTGNVPGSDLKSYPCNTGNGFRFSRVARAVLADTVADNVYDFNNIKLIEDINEHYKVKSQQLDKIEAVKRIFNVLKDYIVNNLFESSNGNQFYIKLPISFINALNSNAAKRMMQVCYKQKMGGVRLGYVEGGRGALMDWTFFRPADMFSYLPIKEGKGDKESDKYKQNIAIKLFKGIKKTGVKEEDLDASIDIIDKKGLPDPTSGGNNFDSEKLSNLAAAFSYAIGAANMTGNAYDENNVKVSIDTGDELKIKVSNEPEKKELSKYGYVCFDTSYNNQTYNVSGEYENGEDVTFLPKGEIERVKVRAYLDKNTRDTDVDNFMVNLQREAESFKQAYVAEEKAIENNDDWAVLDTKDQLKKIVEEINKVDLSAYKIKQPLEDQMESQFRGVDSFNGVRSGNISSELYKPLSTCAPLGPANKNGSALNEEEYKLLAQDITKAISKVNDKHKELDKKTRDNESAIASDEITLSLGGPESAVENSKFYKSVSSLLNEFCNACPPYHDYEAEARRKTEYAKGAKQEDVAEYIDADGNKQSLDLKGEAPTYNLTWDIIGSYNDGKGEIPVVGLHYRIPRKVNKLRVYKWGTGNPNMHAVKNVNITTSSEFALLSSAANSSLKLGIGGEKVAIKGSNGQTLVNGSSKGEIVAEYNNYKSTEEPAYFKSVISENDQHNITDAVFQAINKGSITILGDPSLRFGGYISPMMYPIYLDIDLQNEGATWHTNKSTKSTLSGVYVVSKITHSINASGYLTTLEVMRYPGINEVITV